MRLLVAVKGVCVGGDRPACLSLDTQAGAAIQVSQSGEGDADFFHLTEIHPHTFISIVSIHQIFIKQPNSILTSLYQHKHVYTENLKTSLMHYIY
jgi:hypothetical protein